MPRRNTSSNGINIATYNTRGLSGKADLVMQLRRSLQIDGKKESAVRMIVGTPPWAKKPPQWRRQPSPTTRDYTYRTHYPVTPSWGQPTAAQARKRGPRVATPASDSNARVRNRKHARR
eukprot:IDg10882t1